MNQDLRLNGPRIAPASGGAPKQLVILVHGYGADGNDLITLGREWARWLPETAFVAPNAPHPCAGGPFGYEWFPISQLDPHLMSEGARSAGPVLDGFLDAEIEAHGLKPDQVALVGFSQGTMMALHVGLRRAGQLACVVGYSGALAAGERLQAELRSRPPVLLIHGDADQVIPVAAIHHASAGLAAAEVPVEWHVTPGLGHGIDARGLEMGGRFLAQRFAEVARDNTPRVAD